MDDQTRPCRVRLLTASAVFVLAGCAHTPAQAPHGPRIKSVLIKESATIKMAPETWINTWEVHELATPAQVHINPKIKTQHTHKTWPARTVSKKIVTSRMAKALPFDIPIAYNGRVKYWVGYFQTSGRSWYTKWLERSSRYLPTLQKTLARHGLPKDLAYIAMIESGFSSQASSTAQAVGPWQFIRETGMRYGLKINWWLDERRDFQKSTDAAAKYLKRLYGMFHNWYLVAASYNTGENRIIRAIMKHGTANYWKMAHLENETRDYVPKLIAALLIAKAPGLYGFRNIRYNSPLQFEIFRIPGGTRLDELAMAIGVPTKVMRDLNPSLTHAYIPSYVNGYVIRIPKGTSQLASLYFRASFVSER